MAPSGGGKGTVASFITRDYGIPHISTGDIFRRHVADGTPIGQQVESCLKKGTYAPDDVTIEVLLERISLSDCANGFILDGFPRTLNQAQTLDEKIQIDAVIELDVTDEIVMNRLVHRWMCRKCGTIHNSGTESIENCKLCSSTQLYQRDDDKQETIIRRLSQYRERCIEPLKFYHQKGKLFSVHVKQETTPEQTYEKIKAYFDEKGIKT